MIAFSIPLPPSANRIWRGGRNGGRPYLSPAYSHWKHEAGAMMQAMRLGKVAGAFDAEIILPETMRGDVDNRVKPILDLCKEIGVTDDDKHCRSINVRRAASAPNGTCTVTIKNSATAGDAGAGQQGVGMAPTPISQEARRGVSPQG